eukprot:jgi/Chlat1/8500/Chrsp80S07894
MERCLVGRAQSALWGQRPSPAPAATSQSTRRSGGNGARIGPKRVSATSNDSEEKAPQRVAQKEKEKEDQALTLDDVNPIGLGRKSRQFVDDVWKKFSALGQVMGGPGVDEDYIDIGGPYCDFEEPNARFTKVLVVGATGRVGRVLLRKLLLRGYTVKALLRRADEAALEIIPRSVEVVVGDVGEPSTLAQAVEGCQKVIYCARARSTLAVDITRVEQQGVQNLAKAFQDYNNSLATRRAGLSSKSKLRLVDFKKRTTVDAWETSLNVGRAADLAFGKIKLNQRDKASLELTERGSAVFNGYLYSKGSSAETSMDLHIGDGRDLARYEGILLRACGDGRPFSLVLTTQTEDGASVSYAAKFNAKNNTFSTVRIPFSAFEPSTNPAPPLDPRSVRRIAFRYESKKQRMRSPTPATKTPEEELSDFRLEIEFVKAFPAGEEPDFILVSCAGNGVDPEHKEKVVKAKQAGETSLRNSGLGYTIVRPGLLREEPGGSRALVFDQGDRITQGISCADVADVCLKALHDSAARNKSFEVCYEYSNASSAQYELVAHLPDKANNYLTPALAVLERNT